MAKLLLVGLLCVMLSGIPAISQDAPQVPVDVPPQTAQELLLKRGAPIYPPLARQARIQGTVVLRIIISQTGEIRNVQLVSGHPMLAPAAIDAVRHWQYKPYLVDGKPVEVGTNVQVNFKLDGEPPPSGVVGDAPGGLPPDTLGAMAVSGSGVRVSEAVMRTMRTEKVDPIYPPAAVQARIEGLVLLELQINKAGDVAEVKLISGHPMLAPAAIEAVKGWKYKSYLLNGEPVAVDTTARLDFSLSHENPSEGQVSEPLAPQRIRISSGVESELIVNKVSPAYPPEARAQHIQGTVILKANIDKQGNVYQLELITGDPTLAEAAMEAVKQWKYKPFLLNGEAVEVETQIQVNFVLQPN